MKGDKLYPVTGRMFKESSDVINIADLIDAAVDIYGGVKTLAQEHSKIHQGKGWEVSIETGSILTLANYYVLFRVGEGEFAHLRSYKINTTEGPVTVRLFESPTVDVVGSLVQSRNRNRNQADTNGVSVYTEPTISNDGVRLETDVISSSGNKIGGNIDSFYEEWILKESTDYVLKITNGSNNSITAVINAFWYI